MADALPTWDEAFTQPPQAAQPPQATTQAAAPTSPSLPTWDQAFTHTSTAGTTSSFNASQRILGAFGQGYGESFKEDGPLGLTQDSPTYKTLKQLGLVDGMQENQRNILGGITDVITRQAAIGLDTAYRALITAPVGGVEKAGEQIGTETGIPALGREVSALPQEVMEATPFGLHAAVGLPEVPLPVARARANAIIGEGEAGYFGTRDPGPEQLAARQEAASALPMEEHATAAAEAEPANIHAVARTIAPDTFQKYDALDKQREGYRADLSELAEQRQKEVEASAPHSAEDIDALKAKLEDATPRMTKKYQERLETWMDENEKHISEHTETGDTAEMQEIRRKLQEADYQMRDLAPEVSAAYRTAHEHMPGEGEPEVAETQQAPNDAAQAPAPAEAEKPQEATQPEIKPEATRPIEAQKQAITDDVIAQLTAAGRPQEEASAAAQLVSEHYQARSERFGGKNGTAEEMYARDGAKIKAGRERTKAREFAQPAKGRELQQPARGKISLATDEAKATITLMKSANASTFIHETGHHWLEELMNDANDHYAPESLKNDALTVRKWLGVADGEEIATRQHEKFARGFERYLMEGTAPSKALANVFAKFKEWLTNIYKTVDKLRSPINDDIRDVFDRLLSPNPEKTVIAPDHEPGKMLADIHEADARHTEPAEAAPVRDNIEKEIDRTANLHDPEVHDALIRGQTKPATESGELTATATDAGGPSATAQPTDLSPSPTAQPNTVTEGSSEARGKSSTASGAAEPAKPEPGGQQPDESKPGEQQPNANFRESKSEFVDKAGNIRVENLSNSADVQAALRELAEKNGAFSDARRGIVTDQEVTDLADSMGVDAREINLQKLREMSLEDDIPLAVRIKVGRQMLVQSTLDSLDAMKKAATGSMEDLMKYADAKERHLMIAQTVSGITAEWGRAGRAFRDISGEAIKNAENVTELFQRMTGRTADELRQEAILGSKLETPQQVAGYIRDSTKPNFIDKMLEYRNNNLLSGPITHTHYIEGNLINALYKPLVQIPASAAVGAIREARGETLEGRVYLGESSAMLHSMVDGSRKGWKAATESWKTDMQVELPGEKYGTPRQRAIPGKLGEIINLPTRAIKAIHSFNKVLTYEQNIAGLSYRQAMKEGLEEGSKAFTDRVSDIANKPSEEIMNQATKDSLREVYMAPLDYNSAAGKLSQAIQQTVAGRFLIPFFRTEYNVKKLAFTENSALGFFSKDVRATLAGAKGDIARDMQIAKMSAGTALAGIGYALASTGKLNGSGPHDKAEYDVWKLTHSPNSLQIGGITVPLRSLGTAGQLFLAAANVHESLNEWHSDDMNKFVASFIEHTSKTLFDGGFAQNIKDALDAVFDYDRYGQRYLDSFATQWLPAEVGMGQIARAIDPYARQSHGLVALSESKIPVLSQSLPPRRDMFGVPIPSSGTVQSYASDPVVQKLDELHMGIGRLGRSIRGVRLTDEQYDRYSMVAGVTLKQQLDGIVTSNGFSSIPAESQHDIIRNIVERSNEYARGTIMMEYPDIIQKAAQNKFGKISSQMH